MGPVGIHSFRTEEIKTKLCHVVSSEAMGIKKEVFGESGQYEYWLVGQIKVK